MQHGYVLGEVAEDYLLADKQYRSRYHEGYGGSWQAERHRDHEHQMNLFFFDKPVAEILAQWRVVNKSWPNARLRKKQRKQQLLAKVYLCNIERGDLLVHSICWRM